MAALRTGDGEREAGIKILISHHPSPHLRPGREVPETARTEGV